MDIIGDGCTFKLGDQEYTLDYTMASIYYLVEKYGDITKLFGKLGKGIDKASIDLIADMTYAGLLTCNDDDKFVAPISAKKILSKMRMSDMESMAGTITNAFAKAFPVPKDPTKAGKDPAKVDGTSDISIQPDAQN